MTPAERAKAYRDRRRGGPARHPDDSPLARARRKTKAGEVLDDDEAAALRAYRAERQRAARA